MSPAGDNPDLVIAPPRVVVAYTDRPPRRAHPLVRVLGVMTLAVAAGWAWGAQQVSRYIARQHDYMLLGTMLMGPGYDEASQEHLRQLVARGAIVEVTREVWRLAMWGVAAVIAIAGLIQLTAPTSSVRPNQIAAAAMFLAMLLTFAGIYTLIAYGGFPNTLRPLAYVIIGVTHLAYVPVLLASNAFARPTVRPGR